MSLSTSLINRPFAVDSRRLLMLMREWRNIEACGQLYPRSIARCQLQYGEMYLGMEFRLDNGEYSYCQIVSKRGMYLLDGDREGE